MATECEMLLRENGILVKVKERSRVRCWALKFPRAVEVRGCVEVVTGTVAAK